MRPAVRGRLEDLSAGLRRVDLHHVRGAPGRRQRGPGRRQRDRPVHPAVGAHGGRPQLCGPGAVRRPPDHAGRHHGVGGAAGAGQRHDLPAAAGHGQPPPGPAAVVRDVQLRGERPPVAVVGEDQPVDALPTARRQPGRRRGRARPGAARGGGPDHGGAPAGRAGHGAQHPAVLGGGEGRRRHRDADARVRGGRAGERGRRCREGRHDEGGSRREVSGGGGHVVSREVRPGRGGCESGHSCRRAARPAGCATGPGVSGRSSAASPRSSARPRPGSGPTRRRARRRPRR